jgi:hypothetical protein|tara:strand:+ start:1465 stop:2667 length:1203 start_codon:yes stop_codon:yes gene_type:complete
MKVTDIVGTKKRLSRDSRKRRLVQKDLYTPDLKKLSEDAGGARIQHVEDLILWNGSQGAKKAIATLHQVEQQPNSVTIKWDGSPAVMFGRNEKGEFILTDKSGFSAKGYDGKPTSSKGLQQMLMNRPGASNPDAVKASSYKKFAGNMANIWSKVESCVPADFRGYVLGDLLWFTKPDVKDNKYSFTPNTTTYAVKVDSEVGKKISDSEVGVVIHMAVGLDGEKSNVDMTQLQGGSTYIMPPVMVTKSPGVDIPAIDELERFLDKNAQAIDKLFAVPPELKMADFGKILYAYINNSVKASNLDDLGNTFQAFVEGSKLSEPKKKRIMEYINTNMDGFNATFNFIKGIMKVKNMVITALDSQDADVEAYTAGQRGGEGYVVDKDVKLVNRAGFTAANMAKAR